MYPIGRRVLPWRRAVVCADREAAVGALRRRVNDQVLGDAAYWQAKRTAKYATLLTFVELQDCSRGPALPVLAGRAWVCMTDSAARRAA